MPEWKISKRNIEINDLQRQGLADVIDYAVQRQKTGKVKMDKEGGVVLQQFVSGVNCHSGTACEEMLSVKAPKEM